MIECKLCHSHFETNQSLTSHLSNNTSPCKTNIKEYYDKYLRKQNEGMCIYCGQETYFYGLGKGYMNNICKICNRNNIDVNKNIKKSRSLKKTLGEKKKFKNQ